MNGNAAQWLTLGLMVFVALQVVLYDVWLARVYGLDATFSRVSAFYFQRFPIVFTVAVFAIGVLIGHVLLPCRQ
jgi:hypothetical protein